MNKFTIFMFLLLLPLIVNAQSEQLLVNTITKDDKTEHVVNTAITVNYLEPSIKFIRYNELSQTPFAHLDNPNIVIFRAFESETVYYVVKGQGSIKFIVQDNTANSSKDCYKCDTSYIIYGHATPASVKELLTECRSLYKKAMEGKTKYDSQN